MAMKLHEFTAIVVLIMIVAWVGFTAMTPGLYASGKNAGLATPNYAGTANAPAAAVEAQTPTTNAGTGTTGSPTGSAAGTGGSGQAVTIPIKVVNGVYEPRVITVKQGDKVKLVMDAATFRGCMSTFNIWGIQERFPVSAGNNVMEFTADKPGTYQMSCPMGMGNGQFIVQTSDGKVVAPAPGAAKPAGGSCGMGAGCGCGMMG